MFMRTIVIASAAVALAGPAVAVSVPTGTVTFVALFNPIVDLSKDPSTAIFNGATFEVSGLGGFTSSTGKNGSLTGSLNFSKTPGTTIPDPVTNFFQFDDGTGGSYAFSLASVLTQTFSSTPGVSQSFSLYLLGTTSNVHLGYDPTATSLTIGLTQTAGSGYSASGTLAIPPAVPQIPEASTWAMFIGGFGMIGGAMRHRRKLAVKFR